VAICICSLALGAVHAAQLRDLLSPVTRVVKLLQDLSKQVEAEGKAEENLFESFVCWGKSVVAQKTESNAAAKSRADSLATYIADLGAGRVELTTERQDLEKEIAELTGEVESAKALREKENQDFNSAKDEMTSAKTALTSAIKVLDEATKDHKAALMIFKNDLNTNTGSAFASIAAQSASLNQAVDLGDRFLDKADALFLRSLLTGVVPMSHAQPKDQKMLRKKADFKKSYKARSGKIQGVLAKLHATFSKNLQEAEDKEATTKASFDKLSKSKGAQLKAAQDALTKGDAEGGARGVSKKQAEDEKEALETQVSEDTKFIQQTETSLAEKKTEWGDRSKLRDGELAAISKAVSILYSDDARDNFKKSFKSQGASLLQSDLSASEAMATFGVAATALESIASKTGDRRLSALAALAAEGAKDPSAKEKFGPVLAAVDKMLEILKGDEKSDLATKETCEKDRMEDTRDTLETAKKMDENTDTIARLVTEISEIKAQVATWAASKVKAQEELDSADKIRKNENAQFKTTQSEDQEAADTVKSAKTVLTKYYADAFKAALVQQKAPTVVEGQAPPPPPATWDGGYGGKKGESTGIIGILEMVHADILKDKATAQTEEKQAQKEFDEYKTKTETQMDELQSEIDKKNGVKGEKQQSKVETTKERATQHELWATLMKKMKDSSAECEYFTVNYKLRVSNRQLEVDGLNKAKAILKGGSFSK